MLDREWRAQAAELTGTAAASASSRHPPRSLHLATPRSACPAVRPHYRIAEHSGDQLAGASRTLRGLPVAISKRYPLVELATAVLSAWVGGTSGSRGRGLRAAGHLDADCAYRYRCGSSVLPDSITLPLLWAGLLAAVLIGPQPGVCLPVSPRDAIIGAAAGYLSSGWYFRPFGWSRGKEGMGYGDFKLFAAWARGWDGNCCRWSFSCLPPPGRYSASS